MLRRVIKHLAHAITPSRAERPHEGRIILPRREDSIRDYPGSALTPSKLIAILRQADGGSLSAAMQLFEEMEEKDPHLFSVANTRRLAVTGLKWRIVSAADENDAVDRTAANEAAAYCREALAGLQEFDDVLQHLSLAIGRNIAIAELIWGTQSGEFRLLEMAPIDFTRIVFDEFDQLHILTEEEPRNGIAMEPGKFIVHTPHSRSGHPQRGGLLRVTAMVYLAKNMALKDWLIYSEIFGMPVRVARYGPGATPDEKRELARMLESLGTHAAGIFSRAVELQILNANQGNSRPPYEDVINYLNREMSKAWLGQTLTTDTADARGTLAVSTVHNEVREDIRKDDLRKEALTIRRDVLAPMTRMRLGANAPIPLFERLSGDVESQSRLVSVLDVAVNRLGARIPSHWLHERLRVPEAAENETALRGETRPQR